MSCGLVLQRSITLVLAAARRSCEPRAPLASPEPLVHRIPPSSSNKDILAFSGAQHCVSSRWAGTPTHTNMCGPGLRQAGELGAADGVMRQYVLCIAGGVTGHRHHQPLPRALLVEASSEGWVASADRRVTRERFRATHPIIRVQPCHHSTAACDSVRRSPSRPPLACSSPFHVTASSGLPSACRICRVYFSGAASQPCGGRGPRIRGRRPRPCPNTCSRAPPPPPPARRRECVRRQSA